MKFAPGPVSLGDWRSRSANCLGVAWLLAGLVLALVIGQTGAQTPAGGLRGKVLDADFSQPLPNVTVRVEETGQAVQTDASGNYFFNELAPGTYGVSASRGGYRPQTGRRVAIAAGSVAEASFELAGEVVELDDFVVTAEDLVGTDAAQLLDVRQSLTSFAEVIGADFISRVGASDAGEALIKSVGTSVADSRYVVVRGLSDRYNTILVNGSRVPSSDPDRRAVNVDIFPGNLIGSLVNTKTFTADLPGEATGGNIDIRLKGLPEKDFFAAGVGLEFNTQTTGNRRFLTYSGGGTGGLGTAGDRRIPAFLQNVSTRDLPAGVGSASPQIQQNRDRVANLLDRTTGPTTGEGPIDLGFSLAAGRTIDFFGQPLGLLGAVTYKQGYGYDDRSVIGRERGGAQSQLFRVRQSAQELLAGLLLSAGYKPADGHTIQATYFTNLAAEDEVFFQIGQDAESGEAGDPENGIPFDQELAVAVKESLQYTERRLSTYFLSGAHEFGEGVPLRFDWAGAFSTSYQDQPDQRFTNYRFERLTNRVFGLGNFSGDQLERIFRRLDDQDYNISANLRIPLFSTLGDKAATLKIGGAFDRAIRDFRADNFAYVLDYNNLPPLRAFDPDNRVDFTPADLVGPLDLIPAPPGQGGLAFLTRPQPAEIYEAAQNITAGYGLMSFNIGPKIEANLGARVEQYDLLVFRDLTGLDDAELAGILSINLATGQPRPLAEASRALINESKVLPSFTIGYEFVKDMKLRFAASRTTARPSFKEIAPVFTRDPGSSRRFVGNTELETSDIDNIDLRYEWFPVPGAVIAASGFTKYIDRPIELNTAGSFDFFVNEVEAVLYGYEFEVQRSLDLFDPALKDFNLALNFTKLYSSVTLTERTQAGRNFAGLPLDRRLQGQPDTLLNFNLTYESKELGLFAGLFLNFTGEILYAAGGLGSDAATSDVSQRPFSTLDFTLSKKLTDNLKVTLRASNLLNEPRSRVYSSGAIFSKERAGVDYSVSVSGEW